jgi:hypothetical protein
MYRHIFRDCRCLRMYFGHDPKLHIEVSMLCKTFGVGLDVGDSDDAFLFRLSLWFFSLYVGLSSARLYRLSSWLRKGSYEPRSISLRVFDWAIWYECWAPAHSWSRGEPWWMRWTWHPLDTFFGRMQHSVRDVVSSTATVIPMPEKAYPCVVVIQEEVWKRSRLPWASTVLRRAHIDVPGGVPFPGKGENSWDCGDDATHSMTCPAETVEQGVARFVESVLRDRRRYGGSVNWQQAAAA